MFLALKEIKHEKLRYSLVIGMIVLIAYLILMLLGLMQGLGNENTAAVKSWDTKQVMLDKNANVSMNQSLITKEQAKDLTKHEALVGQARVAMKGIKHGEKQSMQYFGLDSSQYLLKDKIKLTEGRKPRNDHELILDESLKDKGYRLGQKVKLNSLDTRFKVVGFTKDAKFNIAPLAIGSLATWRELKGTGQQFVASAIWADQTVGSKRQSDLAHYGVKTFIKKLPGYTAQNTTFEFMIGFLLMISLIVIAIFLYILTMQKEAQYAVLRAQGIPAGFIVWSTIAQSVILMVSGVVIATILALITSLVMPSAVPFMIMWLQTMLLDLALLVVGIAGALLPVRMILKIDPVDALQ